MEDTRTQSQQCMDNYANLRKRAAYKHWLQTVYEARLVRK